MKKEKNLKERVLIKLLKEPFSIHTITSIAGDLNVTRQGLWKTIKKLKEESIIKLEFAGNTKTSTSMTRLNWENPLLEKVISFELTKEALREERWKNNFAGFEPYVKFLILFGSILNNPKEANDIDILAVVKNKNSFKAIDESLSRLQKTQAKKIHLVDLTKEEFTDELKKQNRMYADAVKKGVVLFGIDNYTKFIRTLNEK